MAAGIKNTDFDRLAALDRAIDGASKEVLQRTLKDVCRGIEQAREAVIGKIVIPEDQAKHHPTEKVGSKRYRPRYAECANCDKEFDITANTGTSCCYHPDETEPDYDAFPDHDEDIHGEIDSEELRQEYPENYIYICCDKRGDQAGCTIDFHVEAPAKKQKV